MTVASVIAASCSGDLNLGGYTFACQKDSDCETGQRCDRTAGCVTPPTGGDGGSTSPDTGPRAGGVRPDAGDDGGPQDGSTDDGGPDAGDAGAHDAGDAGPGDDAGDAGASRDAGLVLWFSSINDTTAGVCTSSGYALKSVTGWTAGFRWAAGGYVLQPGEPYRQ